MNKHVTFTFGLLTLILGCRTHTSSYMTVVHAQTSATSHPEYFFCSDLYFCVAVKKVRCTSATNKKPCSHFSTIQQK